MVWRLSASASAAHFFAELFFFGWSGLPSLLFRSGLCRPFQVFSAVIELAQFALLGGKRFLEQIPASVPKICLLTLTILLWLGKAEKGGDRGRLPPFCAWP